GGTSMGVESSGAIALGGTRVVAERSPVEPKRAERRSRGAAEPFGEKAFATPPKSAIGQHHGTHRIDHRRRQAVGVAPELAWASGENCASIHMFAVHSICSHADGQAAGSSIVTSIIASGLSSDPPKRRRVITPNRPLSRISATFRW